jgi:hypothetical protein
MEDDEQRLAVALNIYLKYFGGRDSHIPAGKFSTRYSSKLSDEYAPPLV